MVQSRITVRRRFTTPICAVALLIGGCPKRQTVPRVVYIQSPPSASEPAAAETTETIVIEEPALPEPEAKAAEAGTGQVQETAPKHIVRRRRTTRPDAPGDSEVDQPAEPASPPSAEVPALEPQETQQKQAELRREILAAQEDTQKHLTVLDRVQLAGGDRKTLDDARTFLAQSSRELERGELVRAMNLARKAALLVSAVEQSH